MELEKALKLSKQFWARIGAYAISTIRQRSASGRGVKNGRIYNFPAYSDTYEEYKRKKGRNTALPDFTFSGRTLGDLKQRAVTNSAVVIGWGGEHGLIVDKHMEIGRYMVGALADKEIDKIVDTIDDQIERNWDRNVKSVKLKI